MAAASASLNSNSNSNTKGSLLWTVLLCGLLACLVNIFYEATTILGRLHLSRFDPVQGELLFAGQGESQAARRKKDLEMEQRQQAAPQNHKPIDWDAMDPQLLKEKGHLIQLIKDAGVTDITEETIRELPSWEQVTNLYGDEPVLLGLPQQCHKFQQSGNASMHFISTAGTFNSGTNLMAELLFQNCHLPEHEKAFSGGAGVRWQVTWGKHSPVNNETFRLTHRTYKDPNYLPENIFPAVMIRDPYKWAQSMCRHRYEAKWDNDRVRPDHCPNLVRKDLFGRNQTVPVRVKYSEFTKTYPTLIELYNEYYAAYLRASFPYVMVRIEDLVYFPRRVVEQVCACAGGKTRPKFKYIVDSAKRGPAAHGDFKQRTSYVQALIRYGTRAGRYQGFDPADLEYAKQHLDPALMRMFHYPFHGDSFRDAGT